MPPDLLDVGRLPHLAVLVVWALPVARWFDIARCVSQTMRRVRNALAASLRAAGQGELRR